MKTNKEYLIYTNDPYDFNEEEMKQAYLETAEANDWEVPEEGPSDEDIWQEWYDQCDLNFQDMCTEIKFHNEMGSYLIVGTLGLWRGTFPGGTIVDGYLHEAIQKCFEDYNRVYMKNRNLCVSAIHHDGTNSFIIKKLTDRGIDYFNKHCWDMTDEELHQRLFNDSHYTHSVRFFADLYGWKV